ncbi:hypothetical protein SAMN04515621_2900 [Erythrobacter sp. HL-111]|nr:MAG: hypothetical protein HLUCCO15_12030 [Erythrobacteraceae bacterium HL-111]SDT09632.1 hypothetical protein SAMN04515621_2900 [Erythrobacter sp. HL-111]
MVSHFEWAAIGLILFGMVLPFWTLTVIALRRASKEPRRGEVPASERVLRYNAIMDYLHRACRKGPAEGQSGASFIAAVRELRNYPEHRDLTVLFLEEINVSGTGKFNELAKREIRAAEEYLLALKEDA